MRKNLLKLKKVAIIGAGINGLYLAWKLSKRNHQVTVFEKKERIGKEVCSGLFSKRILEFIPESKDLIQNQIESVLIHLPSDSEAREKVKLFRTPKKTIRVKFSKKFLVMSHTELDRLTAVLAEKAGAKIVLNHPIDSLPQGFDRIIGCDGVHSIVRKKLGLSIPSYRLSIQGFIPKICYSDFVEAWPVNQGFIWKIPRGKNTEYGIIAGLKEAKFLFENFSKENNLQLKKLESALVPQGFIIPKHQSITLCGDAVGLTKPWSGGGVIWGLMAAEILLRNFPDFLKYQKALEKFFLPKILFSKIATRTAYFLGNKMPWLLPGNIKIESDFLI